MPTPHKMPPRRRKLLVLSQVFVPDPASVGQHMADLAVAVRSRGTPVTVYAADRGYDDPSQQYASGESIDGVDVRRFPFSSFGKTSVAVRLLAGTIFMLQCMGHGLLARNLGGVLVSTSPPMCAIAAVLIARLKRVPIIYWVMDLNPDQMIALGKLPEKSLAARAFNALNRFVLRRAKVVVALDRFMADRINRKVDVTHKLVVMPPWPHEDQLESIPHADNPFRAKMNWREDQTVIMYSGNHGFSTPVSTVLQAALKLQDRKDIQFAFIGGGVGKKEVDATIAREKPANIVSLPYQPFSQIKYSLSAADVHLVSVGDDVVGIVHPCKVYGAMALSRPILLLGPDPCHVSDVVGQNDIGWHIRHGDVDGAVRAIEAIAATTQQRRDEMGRRAAAVVASELSKVRLCGRMCDVVEAAMG